MDSTQVTEKVVKILDYLEQCNELKIDCKHGSVWLRFNEAGKLDCTYFSKFGHLILHQLIKDGNMNKDYEKLVTIASHVCLYSEKVSGIVFLMNKWLPFVPSEVRRT